MDQKNLPEYFIKRTDERLAAIEKKIDKLISMENRRIGSKHAVSAIISSIVSAITAVATIYLGK